MEFLHTMIRIKDVETSLKFYTEVLGLKLDREKRSEKGRFTLYFLTDGKTSAEIELTHNWDNHDDYSQGRNFGHLAYKVDNIYDFCDHAQKKGVPILRPPRDGHMAFIKCPDGISIELLQKGKSLPPQEPWASMENSGSW